VLFAPWGQSVPQREDRAERRYIGFELQKP
jgi:hypothetical protein